MVDISLASKAQNPDNPFSVTAQDKEFPTVGLDREEAQLLEDQVNELIADFDSELLNKIIEQRAGVIANHAAFAKQVFDEKRFAGIQPGDNEIGFDILRPGHIFNDSTGTRQNDWYFDPGGTGWTDWIGDGTSANNRTYGADETSIVLGLMDQEEAQSEISGVNVDQFGREVDLIPQDTMAMRLKDNENDLQFTSFPTLIAQENDEIHVRLRFDRNVERQPRLFGFTFALGTFLNTEDF